MKRKIKILRINLNEKKIIKLYKSGLTTSKLGKIFNVDKKTIINRLIKNNIERRQNDKDGFGRKYKISHSFFNKINSPAKAYWLGFLLADGCNTGGKIIIVITDKKHLNKFNKLIYPAKDYRLKKVAYPYPCKNQYRIQLSSKQLINDLTKLGMIERKSKVVKFPNVPKKFYPHLIRGIFDGDGSISFSFEKKYKRFCFDIVGSKYMMRSIQKILKNNNLIVGFGKNKNIYRIFKSGNRQILKIMNWLYKNSNPSIFLERKFKIYCDLKKSYEK